MHWRESSPYLAGVSDHYRLAGIARMISRAGQPKERENS
jgi:hypothetical protein